MTVADDIEQLINRELESRRKLRDLIRRELAEGERYCRQIAEAWTESPYPDIRSTMRAVSHELNAMEEAGELTSRVAEPDDHGRSRWVRRYFALAEVDR